MNLLTALFHTKGNICLVIVVHVRGKLLGVELLRNSSVGIR